MYGFLDPPSQMNWITTTLATWNGGTSSCWRDDTLLVDGFNESMRHGGLDREFGERLMNAGIRVKQCRYSLRSLHSDHSRPYADPVGREQNIHGNLFDWFPACRPSPGTQVSGLRSRVQAGNHYGRTTDAFSANSAVFSGPSLIL